MLWKFEMIWTRIGQVTWLWNDINISETPTTFQKIWGGGVNTLYISKDFWVFLNTLYISKDLGGGLTPSTFQKIFLNTLCIDYQT